MNTDSDTSTTAAQTGAEGVAAPASTPADAPSESTSTNDATTPAAPATTTPDDGADARRALLRAILRTLPLEVRAVLLAALAAWVRAMIGAVQVLGAVGAVRPPTRPGTSVAEGLAACAVTMTAKDAAKAMMRAACDALMESPALTLDATTHANACAAVWFSAAVYDCEQRYPLAPELLTAAGDVEALMATVRDALEVRAAIASRGYDPATVLRDAVPAAGIGALAVEMPPGCAGPQWIVRADIVEELRGCGCDACPVLVRLPMPAEGGAPGAPPSWPVRDPSQGAPVDAHQGEGEALDIRGELAAIVRDAALVVRSLDGALRVDDVPAPALL